MNGQHTYIGFEELQSMSDLITEDDKVLLRYEMLREQIVTKATIKSVSNKYGYNPRHFYWCRNRFKERGIFGLVDREPGPKNPHKVTPEVERKILHFRKKDLSIYEIADELERQNVKITPKSVDVVLNKHHKPKKKRGRKSKR